MSIKKKKAVFKPYNPDQISLFSPSLNELISENHVVRVVRNVIVDLNIDSIKRK